MDNALYTVNIYLRNGHVSSLRVTEERAGEIMSRFYVPDSRNEKLAIGSEDRTSVFLMSEIICIEHLRKKQ